MTRKGVTTVSLTIVLRGFVLALLLGGLLTVTGGDVYASHRGSLEERRAAREAERAARRAEREAERAARDAAKEAERALAAATCNCRASLDFGRPDLRWVNGVLTLTPRIDITVRTRGESTGPDWSVGVEYQGASIYSSDDVAVPASTSFSGSQSIVSGQCGNNRYSFDGIALEPVTLAGLTRTLLGFDQELEGAVRMQAAVTGCQEDVVDEWFQFDLEEQGAFRARNWRTFRG